MDSASIVKRMVPLVDGVNPCAICGSVENTIWCAACQVWLCERCQGDYWARTKAAGRSVLDTFRRALGR